MKPEVRFGIVIVILFIVLFIFARFLAPSISRGVESVALGEGYELIESNKFRIYYPDDIYSLQDMQYLDSNLNQFTSDFRSQMKNNDIEIMDFETCTVYLLRSHKKLQDFGMTMEVADMSNNGGYFSLSRTSIAVIGADLEVLRHEMVHMLLQMSKSLSSNQIKPWMDEAFAQYFEKYPKSQSLNAVESMPTIEEIVNFKREDFSKPDNPKYYKSSLYLLTFLLSRTETSKIVYENLGSAVRSSTDRTLGDLQSLGLESLNVDFRNWYMNLR